MTNGLWSGKGHWQVFRLKVACNGTFRQLGRHVMCAASRIYEASRRHCEPITAQNPGVKCPAWSAAIAQELLDTAEPVGNTLQTTHNGVGFVARKTRTTADGDVWHGYPEAWDRMDLELKKRWREQGRIRGRDLRTYATRRQVRDAFGGRHVGS